MEPGNEAELALSTYPGRIIKAKVDSIIWAQGQGQLPLTGTLPQTGAAPEPEGRFAVKLVLDEREKDLFLAAGARGTGAIYTHHLVPMHIIRKVLLRVSSYLNWIIISTSVYIEGRARRFVASAFGLRCSRRRRRGEAATATSHRRSLACCPGRRRCRLHGEPPPGLDGRGRRPTGCRPSAIRSSRRSSTRAAEQPRSPRRWRASTWPALVVRRVRCSTLRNGVLAGVVGAATARRTRPLRDRRRDSWELDLWGRVYRRVRRPRPRGAPRRTLSARQSVAALVATLCIRRSRPSGCRQTADATERFTKSCCAWCEMRNRWPGRRAGRRARGADLDRARA